jgi:hypothetical protein
MCGKGEWPSSRESVFKEMYVYGPAVRREVIGQSKSEVHGKRGRGKANGGYRIGETNNLLSYVSRACATTD